MKKVLKLILLFVALLVLLVAGLFIAIWIKSPGKTPPMLDAAGNALPNSMVSAEKVSIGGVEQWILIRGKDKSKPVLLFLHGGPGTPEMPMFRAFNSQLEDYFVVVHWDQRGSGKSYSEAIPDAVFTIQQFVEDTHALVALLQQRFGQQKIYLMGHSWGSVIGVLAVKEKPESFHAYIGVGQVAHMQHGEQLSYKYVLEQARRSNNTEALQELQAIGAPPYEPADAMEKMMKERAWVTKFGGAWFGKDNNLAILSPIVFSEEYTLGEKLNYLKGAQRTLALLWPALMQVNLLEEAPILEVPVYIFQGKNDYQTPYVLARQYFEQLKAPRKKFFGFSNTAHSPLYEHPEVFNRLIIENILTLSMPTIPVEEAAAK